MIGDSKINFGDYLRLIIKKDKKEKKFYGHFVNFVKKEKKDFIILKLDNGYNIGIDIKDIIDYEIIEKVKIEEVSETNKKKYPLEDETLPYVVIIHTGGTIASKVDYKTGAVTSLFRPEEIVDLYPEIKSLANIKVRLLFNIMSENLRFKHYNKLAKAIEEEIKEGCDAIIITHGTDTMHYTASALHYMLRYLPVPIVLVGSQRSADRPSSDAFLNLINAIYFAIESHYKRVTICMHETINDDYCLILNAINARKMHSSRRDAFKNVNSTPIARVNFSKKKIEYFDSNDKEEDMFIKRGFGRVKKVFEIWRFKEVRTGILKIYPNINAKILDGFKGYDGLILEGSGLGHIPISQEKENEDFFERIKELIKEGTIVVLTTQCLFGRVNMNVYSNQRRLLEIGIKGNLSKLIPENAFIKLSWLLSNYKKDYLVKNFDRLWKKEDFDE